MTTTRAFELALLPEAIAQGQILVSGAGPGFDWGLGAQSSGAVSSVAGRTGAVVLTHADITDWSATLAPYALTSSLPPVPGPSSTPPAMDSSAAIGTASTYARADHVHPTDTSRYAASNPAGYQTAADLSAAIGASAYALPIASTTTLGGVKVDGTTIHIASGVISSSGGGIADAPANGTTYGRNNNAWLAVSGGGGGITDAPADSTSYVRNNSAWAHIAHTDITDWTTSLAPYALITSVPVASSSAPTMNGSAAAGVATTWSRSDHVHPTDTTRYAASNPAGYVTAATTPVQSVASKTGAVTLVTTDLTDWANAVLDCGTF